MVHGIEGIWCLVKSDEVICGVTGCPCLVTGDVHIVTERHKYVFKRVATDILDVILENKEVVERCVTPLKPVDHEF